MARSAVQNIRRSPAYKNWKESVKLRDGRACRRCGFKNNLHVHHIKPFDLYPEFALVIDNGLTLCGNCHSLVKGKEETTDYRAFLGVQDTKIHRQLSTIDGNFSEILERKLESGIEHIRQEGIRALYHHLDVYPISINEMLPLLISIVDSGTWTDESTTKHQALKWLKKASTEGELLTCRNLNCNQKMRIPVTDRVKTVRITCRNCHYVFEFKTGQSGTTRIEMQPPMAVQAMGRYEQRVERSRNKELARQKLEAQEMEAERREAKRRREQEIITKYGSLEQYQQHLKDQERWEQIKGIFSIGFIVGLLILFSIAVGSC